MDNNSDGQQLMAHGHFELPSILCVNSIPMFGGNGYPCTMQDIHTIKIMLYDKQQAELEQMNHHRLIPCSDGQHMCQCQLQS